MGKKEPQKNVIGVMKKLMMTENCSCPRMERPTATPNAAKQNAVSTSPTKPGTASSRMSKKSQAARKTAAPASIARTAPASAMPKTIEASLTGLMRSTENVRK